jgi:quinol monooxygenase YgiN
MIRVVAVITAKPGGREALVEAFRANAPTVRAEVGCLEYMGVVDAEGLGSFQAKYGPDVFVVIETWESLEALKAHGVAPHMIAFGQKTKDLVADRAIHVLSPV